MYLLSWSGNPKRTTRRSVRQMENIKWHKYTCTFLLETYNFEVNLNDGTYKLHIQLYTYNGCFGGVLYLNFPYYPDREIQHVTVRKQFQNCFQIQIIQHTNEYQNKKNLTWSNFWCCSWAEETRQRFVKFCDLPRWFDKDFFVFFDLHRQHLCRVNAQKYVYDCKHVKA